MSQALLFVNMSVIHPPPLLQTLANVSPVRIYIHSHRDAV